MSASVEELKAELRAVPDQILREIVEPLGHIEDLFERLYNHVWMRTQGTNDPSGCVTNILGLLTQARQDAADLVGFEDRIRTAIEEYVGQV